MPSEDTRDFAKYVYLAQAKTVLVVSEPTANVPHLIPDPPGFRGPS
jgi:hypothetical protein